MYGRSVYSVWEEKYGDKEANRRQKIANEKNAESNRIRRLKEIEEKNGQVIPNYNPDACKLIDEYSKKYGYNFQHAMNGGEICMGGYFPDGVDEKRKTIVEVDENYHFDPNGNLRQRDMDRQKYLEKLGYTVIRLKII